jgi:hypothetical protein
MPYARLQELRQEEPELCQKIEKGQPIRPKVLEFIDEHFAYKYNVQSGFIRRRELFLWKAAKWGQIPMEKYKPYVTHKQTRLLEAKKA